MIREELLRLARPAQKGYWAEMSPSQEHEGALTARWIIADIGVSLADILPEQNIPVHAETNKLLQSMKDHFGNPEYHPDHGYRIVNRAVIAGQNGNRSYPIATLEPRKDELEASFQHNQDHVFFKASIYFAPTPYPNHVFFFNPSASDALLDTILVPITGPMKGNMLAPARPRVKDPRGMWFQLDNGDRYDTLPRYDFEYPGESVDFAVFFHDDPFHFRENIGGGKKRDFLRGPRILQPSWGEAGI